MSIHAPRRSESGDFHLSTLRFVAGEARRALDLHDRRPASSENGRAATARLQRAAQLTQQRLAAAEVRRRARPSR
jgi:hypothetical protein